MYFSRVHSIRYLELRAAPSRFRDLEVSQLATLSGAYQIRKPG